MPKSPKEYAQTARSFLRGKRGRVFTMLLAIALLRLLGYEFSLTVTYILLLPLDIGLSLMALRLLWGQKPVWKDLIYGYRTIQQTIPNLLLRSFQFAKYTVFLSFMIRFLIGLTSETALLIPLFIIAIPIFMFITFPFWDVATIQLLYPSNDPKPIHNRCSTLMSGEQKNTLRICIHSLPGALFTAAAIALWIYIDDLDSATRLMDTAAKAVMLIAMELYAFQLLMMRTVYLCDLDTRYPQSTGSN